MRTRAHSTTVVGFTVLELLIVTVIVTILLSTVFIYYAKLRDQAKMVHSLNNLRELAKANIAYAVDNGGQFCPSQDKRNRIRWHGERTSSGSAFDPSRGFLAPYLGRDGRVKACPLFNGYLTDQTFELGTGGYGYNAAYVGGTPGNPFRPATVTSIGHPSRTVMFATTAFSRENGFQEYPYAEPFQYSDEEGNLIGALQPSVHFRAGGNALVAWCDGHATAEPPNETKKGPNYYGGSNDKHQIGWFGPAEQNGYWNPAADRGIFR